MGTVAIGIGLDMTIGIGVGSVETVLYIIIEPNFIGIGIGVGQWKRTITLRETKRIVPFTIILSCCASQKPKVIVDVCCCQ